VYILEGCKPLYRMADLYESLALRSWLTRFGFLQGPHRRYLTSNESALCSRRGERDPEASDHTYDTQLSGCLSYVPLQS
jgi:hypothetical protein